ncbi:MAG: GreA/GreB family elongation factor [Elusimicrobia bacterium]|nr:GreA/GreB family elongation factor [Elusimicrobiota bacterium]
MSRNVKTQVVLDDEADARTGKISWGSPLAEALLGLKAVPNIHTALFGTAQTYGFRMFGPGGRPRGRARTARPGEGQVCPLLAPPDEVRRVYI